MFSKKKAVFGFMFLSFIFLIVYSQSMPNEKRVYQVNFEEGNLEGNFLRCKDNELFLDIQNSTQTGKGEWNKGINFSPGKISWNWNGQDLNKFSLWLKVTLSDHKSIYYIASGSMNPQENGEYYRDEENRRRFSPSIVISGIPMSTVERDLFEDYTRYCGPAENVRIIKVSAGFEDNSTQHRNILKISDLKIYGKQ